MSDCRCRKCWHFECEQKETPIFERVLFIACSICGNKRCPHATDHELACTDANEPNQPGPYYQDAKK